MFKVFVWSTLGFEIMSGDKENPSYPNVCVS